MPISKGSSTPSHTSQEGTLFSPLSAGQVSVILPTYNEAGNIEPLMRGVLEAVGPEVEIIVVDDDSPDGTHRVVREFGGRHPQVRLVHRTGESGLTSAIFRGVRESRREVVVWMDCDLSMPPVEIPALLAKLRACDIAVGSRYVPEGGDLGHGLLGRVLSRTICSMARILLGIQVRDVTSGFIAARREHVLGLGLRGDYGEYCIDFLHRSQQAGYRAQEVAYVCQPRFTGESKTAVGLSGYMRRGPGYLATVLRLGIKRPLIK